MTARTSASQTVTPSPVTKGVIPVREDRHMCACVCVCVCVLMAPHVETQHHKFKMHPGRENLQTLKEPFFTQHQGYKILFTPILPSSPKSRSPSAGLQGWASGVSKPHPST